MNEMLTLLDARTHVIYDWGTQYSSSPDALQRSRVIFTPVIEYIKPDSMRGLIRSVPTFCVHASGLQDEETFRTFNRVLRKVEDMCKPPTFRKWGDCIRDREFAVAEGALVSTPSFRSQFFDAANRVDSLTAKFLLYRGSLWAMKSEIPLEQSQAFLDEFFRRESLGLGRLDPDEFFRSNAALGSMTNVPFIRQAIPESVRHEVWRRDQGRCVQCGSQHKLEFDHIIPLSKGGGSTSRNIQLLCEGCNRKKGPTLGRFDSQPS